jgi:hypothetical protein
MLGFIKSYSIVLVISINKVRRSVKILPKEISEFEGRNVVVSISVYSLESCVGLEILHAGQSLPLEFKGLLSLGNFYKKLFKSPLGLDRYHLVKFTNKTMQN